MPERTFFRNIIKNLRVTIKISQDKRLIPYYDEYLVASELSKFGHDVEVLKKTSGPDIVVHVDQDRLIEVKSSHIDSEDWACGASFYRGRSITQDEFAYCVFVVFKKLVEPVEIIS